MSKFFQRYKKNGIPTGKLEQQESLGVNMINEVHGLPHEESESVPTAEVEIIKKESPPERKIPPTVDQHLNEILNSNKKDALEKANRPPKKKTHAELPKKEASHTNKRKEHYEIEAESLGFEDLPKNLANSLIAWRKSNRPVVNGTQWSTRLKICRSCSHWMENKNTNTAKCMKCGCSSGKLLLANSNCPLTPPKWKSV